MTDSIKKALARVEKLGKLSLGFYPTRLHKLEKLSEELGVNLWIKREDLSGRSLFGGNKIRKLQYLLEDARRLGCDTVFTYGATQSNHAMQTATAARICGMQPVLFLGAIVEPKAGDLRANLLLDKILGAEVHILESIGSTKETMAANAERFAARKAELVAQGHQVYDIPIGGSTPLGAAGFAEAYLEAMAQAQEIGVDFDEFFTCTGSGGTLAGLVAGQALLGQKRPRIHGVQVGKKDPQTYGAGVAALANDVLKLVGADPTVTVEDFELHADYVGPGYEKPYSQANQSIRRLAKTEGIITDPVYSGKAFHGLLDLIEKGQVKAGANVLFLHTGGATALFSEPEIIGDLAS